MIIANNIIANKLKNVYWIIGSSCGGKTTSAKFLAKKYGMYHYNSDEMRWKHFRDADYMEQPALKRYVPDMNELSVDDLKNWEAGIVREMTPMIIADLIELSGKYEKVVFEGDIDTGSIIPLINHNRIIFLSVCDRIIKRDFFNRPDHVHMIEGIQKRTDISESEKEKMILKMREFACGVEINPKDGIVKTPIEVSKFGVRHYIRDDNSTINKMLEIIEEHFGLLD
jgi:hypothetical protein